MKHKFWALSILLVFSLTACGTADIGETDPPDQTLELTETEPAATPELTETEPAVTSELTEAGSYQESEADSAGKSYVAYVDYNDVDSLQFAYFHDAFDETAVLYFGAFQSETAEKDLTVTLAGETITGEYLYTIQQQYRPYTLDIYGGEHISIAARSDTGQVYSVSRGLPTGGKLSTEECVSIACAIAENYLNPDDYEMEFTRYYEEEGDPPEVDVQFKRFIHGIPLRAPLYINISTEGKVSALYASMLPEAEAFYASHTEQEIDQMAEGLLSEENYALVTAKLDEFYADKGWQKRTDRISYPYFFLDEEGNLCLGYCVSIEFEHNEKTGEELGCDYVFIIIKEAEEKE